MKKCLLCDGEVDVEGLPSHMNKYFCSHRCALESERLKKRKHLFDLSLKDLRSMEKLILNNYPAENFTLEEVQSSIETRKSQYEQEIEELDIKREWFKNMIDMYG